MHPDIATLLASQGGVAATSQLTTMGITRYVLRRLIVHKELIRLPRGIVADPAVWEGAAPWDRHALRAQGLMMGPAGAPGSPLALSHHSALSLCGAASHGVDDRIHIVRTDGRRGRSDAFVQCHSPVAEDQVHERDGVRMVLPELAVLQTAATFGVESGLVSADSCLRDGQVTPDKLQQALDRGGFGNGTSAARTVTKHASGLAESAGESRCRWLFVMLGLPTPLAQAIIRDHAGQFIARVDFLFEDERTVIEFDGRVKYTNPRVLFEEKQREDFLRTLGYIVVRLVWADLAHPDRVRARILEAFSISARHRAS
ncbi:type IV toxin-antitoxin system AbiEi family antitoxin domain-containing protein [Ornithinimicrobium ciconiae]|nr:type IV toxin-antitoxin system AbiEi family antitoxin domain-containing protein [Ornithinimicrobium ciconiae]